MRILLGIGLLLAIFAASSVWHQGRMRELRGLGGFQEARAADPRMLPPGWGEVIVGTPSGAEPVFVEPVRPTESRVLAVDEAVESWTEVPAQEPEPLTVEDWELPVRPGDVLSRIVRVHYGRVSPELEERLARYNGLESPDKLVVGETLYLPPEEKLLSLD